ncbi:MAG: YbaN family protein [Bacteroidales bacterium]
MRHYSLRKSIFIACGVISLALGILGAFLPLLPTTPFILLSAWLFARSSQKYYQRLIQHKWLGPYIRSYQEDKAIPLHAKVSAITLLWVTMLCTIIFFAPFWGLRLLLLTIATTVTWHILSFKTKRPNKNAASKTSKP